MDDFTLTEDALPSGGTGSSASTGDEDQTLVTREGLKKLQDELDYLKKTRRQEVAQRLKEAISYGDLSENSEYEEAKNEQAFVEGRVLELERKVKNAKIISEKTAHKTVEIGSTVTVRNKTSREDAESYTIVGATEADPTENKISNESPLGRAFLGKKNGDNVEVTAPGGMFRYEIMKVA
ncbi:MAG: transcription elongation factor GreA [Candidatus Peregrinibacteria bacterium]